MKLSIEKEIFIAQLDNELAILNGITGKYYTLKGTGIRMWELLQEYKETDEIIHILKQEYSVDSDTLNDDFNHLLSNLMDAKLVIPL